MNIKMCFYSNTVEHLKNCHKGWIKQCIQKTQMNPEYSWHMELDRKVAKELNFTAFPKIPLSPLLFLRHFESYEMICQVIFSLSLFFACKICSNKSWLLIQWSAYCIRLTMYYGCREQMNTAGLQFSGGRGWNHFPVLCRSFVINFREARIHPE